MSAESCDVWIERGLAQGKWFPENTHCEFLVMHEPCPTLLLWLQKAWMQQGCLFKSIYASELDGSDIELVLCMSLLQSPSIIMIVMDIDSSRKMYQRIIEYCLHYQGPYQVILVTSSSKGSALPVRQHTVIEVPKQVDYHLFTVLCQLMHQCAPHQSVTKLFFDYTSRCTNKLTVPQACLLIPYVNLIGRGRDHFFSSWLSALLQSAPSLFTLSQHLFARDARAFYTTWNWVRSRYADEFWATYWSDQLWQAHCFIVAMHMGGQEQASGFSKGLPFSFMQRGWRSYRAELFTDVLALLYQYDCRTKQGGLEIPYELLFQKILTAAPVTPRG